MLCVTVEQLPKREHQPTCEEPEKRLSQPPINWWMNKQASDGMEGCSWWPQSFQERKPQPEQMMPPELKAQNVDNALMSPERALSLLRAKPILASKAPKSSMSVTEDNFEATTENPASRPSSFINLQHYKDDMSTSLKRHQCLVSDFHSRYTFLQLHLHISKILVLYFAVDLPSNKFESATDLFGPAVKPIMLELPEKAIMAECFKPIWACAGQCKTH